MDNDELRRRYRAGDPLDELAADAGMSLGGLQSRLRRIGEPPRRANRRARAADLDPDRITAALSTQGSVAAAARALGVGRAALTARAQQLGILEPPDIPSDLAARYEAGATLDQLAAHYTVSTYTIGQWMRAAAITPRPAGRRPRDG